MLRPLVVAGNVSSVQGIDNHKLGHTRSHSTAADQGLTRSDAEHGIGHGGKLGRSIYFGHGHNGAVVTLSLDGAVQYLSRQPE